jgi:hypothetical protein
VFPPPTPGYEERCYYHQFEGEGNARIFNPEIGKGLTISYDSAQLPYFTQWKMHGVSDYVLGLEPGNCHVDGRDKMRADGKLSFISPGEAKHFSIHIELKG